MTVAVTDIAYVGLLLVSVVAGKFVHCIKEVRHRRVYCTALGAFLVLIVSGRHAVHPCVVSVVNAFIVTTFSMKYRAKASFVFCFGYLVFFKYLKLWSANPPPGITNLVQMMLTLRMAGLAMEQQIIHEQHQEKDTDKQAYEEGDMKPGFWDVIDYAFCYIGVLVGPYYRYRTYRDFLNAPYLDTVDRKGMCLNRVKMVPIYALLWLLFVQFFPPDYFGTEDFYERGLLYKLLYLTPMFIIFRLRIYIGFVLGECVCIMAGLGIYPTESKALPGVGPTDIDALLNVWEGKNGDWEKQEFDYETVHNIDEAQAELSSTMRMGIRSWNRTVQYWLAVYFYKRLPLPKPLRAMLTMTLSAIWHGLEPGYFLCLVTSTAYIVGEEQVEAAVERQRSLVGRLGGRLLLWFCKMQSFTYMLAAFLLLDAGRTWQYYRSVYFLGHAYVAVLLLWRFIAPLHRMPSAKLKQ
uniref:Lysophospholipid acyltransferase 7 n=1 Tax=Rhipicephalus zambeziensis TaxID=60191 RepID=A0A224YSK4_9ACAR